MYLRAYLLLILCLLLPAAASAQEQGDASQERPALPDIAPRTVEIRGQLEISFPSLERQPLVGFNPPPPVVPIPPDRIPFVEEYKQGQADLPLSPLSPPEAPQLAGLAHRAPRSGNIEASFGRYLTRLLRARVETPLSAGGSAYGQLDYRGTSGHELDYLTTSPRSSYDLLEGRVGAEVRPGTVALGADADAFYRAYDVYAAETIRSDRVDTPARTAAQGRAGFWLRPQGSADLDGELRVDLASTQVETDAVAEDREGSESFLREEQRVTTTAFLDAPVTERVDALLDAGYSTAGMDGGGLGALQLLNGTASVRYGVDDQLEITAGAGLLSYTYESGDSPEPAEEATYVVPAVRVDFYPSATLQLYAENTPGAEANSLADVYRINPYLVDEPQLLPTVRTLDATAGARIAAGPVQLSAHAGYMRSPQYLFFEGASAAASGGYPQGLFVADYQNAEIARVGGDASVVLPGGVNASVGVAYRSGRLLRSDADIPYFGPVVARGAVSLPFSGGRGLAQITGEYESARYSDRLQSRQLGDYFSMDARVSYEVSESIGVVARVENISSGHLERWDRYEYAPVIVTAGVRLFW